eukprot:13357116-Ditylum_brightwellii.AAC.1
MSEHSTDYSGFMEINLDTMYGAFQKVVWDAVQTYFFHSTIIIVSLSILMGRLYKSGDTMSITPENLTGRNIEQGSDIYS